MDLQNRNLTNINTKNCYFLKGVAFSKASFWVSMLQTQWGVMNVGFIGL